MYFGLLVSSSPHVQEARHYVAALPPGSARPHRLAVLWRAIANLITWQRVALHAHAFAAGVPLALNYSIASGEHHVHSNKRSTAPQRSLG